MWHLSWHCRSTFHSRTRLLKRKCIKAVQNKSGSVVCGLLSECGSVQYNPGSHMCCGSTVNVIPTNRECCGETAYDRFTHICCDGVLLEKISTNDGCCGLENFRYTTHGCCRGSGNTLEVYNKQSKICCRGVLNDRPTVRTSYCCGTSAYARETHMCCQGSIKGRKVS